jgi:hypothetical protein
MSRIDYTWSGELPPTVDVYTTRRNESKYLTLRYWDGERWYSLDYGPTRGGAAFLWPKKSRTRRPAWAVRNQASMFLRKIGKAQGSIQWGEPYKVFDEKETLAWLISQSVIPKDWRTAFQADMRGAS